MPAPRSHRPRGATSMPLALGAAFALGCAAPPGCGAPAGPVGLTVEETTALVRPDTKEQDAWGAAVHAALGAAGQPIDAQHACMVLAVIEQESGYEADPVVPGLGAAARRALDSAARERLGRFGPDIVARVLEETPAGGAASFGARLDAVRTERALDRLFREMVEHFAGKAPGLSRAVRVLFPAIEERINPVRTAGSMQVAVDWVQAHPDAGGMAPEALREALYTVDGGVLWGTRRLFAHGGDEIAPLHRFADYNAGLWASRNAAFQEALAGLSGVRLALDGDLLGWTARGTPARGPSETERALVAWAAKGAPALGPRQIRDDLEAEKSADFAETATWAAVWAAAPGAPRARVPVLALESPKMKSGRTTEWFAKKVEKRLGDCLRRG